MTHIAIEAASKRRTPSLRHTILPRRLALLGGTTNVADCLIALRYLLHPRQLVQGPIIAEYEHAFAQQVGVRYAYSFCHGRVALYAILRALGIGPGDEVLLQVPTHIVVPNAIRYTGAKPVYIDCGLDTYNINLEQAEQRITSRTKALILQHTFGIPVDLDVALDVARRHNLEVIEDCVHALGSTYGGQQVGSFGRAAFFSTEETKTISTTMGGMAVTEDPELAERIRAFQQRCVFPSALQVARYLLKLVIYHCLTEPHLHYYTRMLYEFFGRPRPLPQATADEEMYGDRPDNYEQRLSNAQATIGLHQLKRLEKNLAHRRATAMAYNRLLPSEGIDIPHSPKKAEPAFVRYPIWVEDVDAVMREVGRYAILGNWFTSVLEEADSPACGNYELSSCPRAEAIVNHLVNLPTHLRVKEEDVETIVSALGQAVTKARV